MEPTAQGSTRDMQETQDQDNQTGATSVSEGENAKSTVMRAAVAHSADQGASAPSPKHKRKITFGAVLFVIGIIQIILSLVTTALTLRGISGNTLGMDLQVVWVAFQFSGFAGLLFMAMGKGLMLLQELVNHARSQAR